MRGLGQLAAPFIQPAAHSAAMSRPLPLQPKGAFLQYLPPTPTHTTPPVHDYSTRGAQQARAGSMINNTQQQQQGQGQLAAAAGAEPPHLSASISLPSSGALTQRRPRPPRHRRRISDEEEEEQQQETTMTTQQGQGGAAAAAGAQPQLAPHPQPALDAPSVAAAIPSTPPQRSPHHALVAYVPAVAGAEAGALTVAGAGGGLPSGVADPLAEDGECEEVSQLERCNVQDRVALTAAVRRVQELCRRTKAAADRSRLSTAESDTLRGLAERVWLWCNRQSAQLAACKDIHAAGKSHTPQAAKLLRAGG